jgi:integrase
VSDKLEAFLDEYIAAGWYRGRQRPSIIPHHGAAHERDGSHHTGQCLSHDRTAGPRCGIKTKIGNHSLRASGITDYLKSGGTLENAQAMANHSSLRTTRLYYRCSDEPRSTNTSG